MPYVVGLDLSVRAPAACVLPSDWSPGDWSSVAVACWPTRSASTTLEERVRRLRRIRDELLELLSSLGPTAVFIEGYAFNATGAGVTKLGELGGVIRVALSEAGHAVGEVPSATVRKLLLGYVPKRDVKALVHKALRSAGAPSAWSGDELDAFVVANFGLTEVGRPCMTFA